ncbi:Proteasome lid subunit RPN8/RPN11, contains Jab1/MPN metalloenzyme (JAMM) motif [Halopenitus malekzadehii]|uniref:Proteasome lid subunit RPN8/RPN11, contains Jab1/MPN metalloenzyme (JAMM) motif n=1 Tax=Halopenitus malekzadehii TaxID=1267564 RepID=A0A1H6IAM1_9EURY|nr:Proteasome lid subunit RPN8/RPN11, contains Jab1/MPN metalloenzyme (JAMM) motif [Halopenitus malekzadehii]
MRLFRSDELLGIARETMEFILEACEDTHPNEYMGFLRAEDARKLDLDTDRSGQVITDVLVIPGTESNPVSATVRTNMKPNDVQSVGSVHSHPNGALRPSAADLATFGQGQIHIIVGAPYKWGDWRVFDNEGDPTTIDVLDVDLPESHFFDFTQADIDRELEAEGVDVDTATDAENGETRRSDRDDDANDGDDAGGWFR